MIVVKVEGISGEDRKSGMSAESEKTCFVVGPIGADDSDDRVHADWLLEAIILPVFAESFKEFSVLRADKISVPGRIDAQVISYLLESDLVIADLTTKNANAFYEIGIRHMVQKPIVHMHLDGENIPFDIASFRSVKFSRRTPGDLRAAQTALKSSVQSALDPAHMVDNPVTVARGRMEIQANASSAETILLAELDSIKRRLGRIEFNGSSDSTINKHETLTRFQVTSKGDSDKDIYNKMLNLSQDSGVRLVIVEGQYGDIYHINLGDASKDKLISLFSNAEKLGLHLDFFPD